MEEFRDAVWQRLEELTRAVCDLEQRTRALEQQAHFELAEPAPEAHTTPRSAMAAAAEGEAALEAASVMPLFGWALMGVAGAYLLRALTETGALPGAAGVLAGIIYAGWWLLLAAHRAGDRPVHSTVHGLTAALILVPMVWEMTVRFHLISPVAASVVVAAFAVMGLAIGWRRKVSPIAWVVTVAALVTASALFRETHDAALWTFTLLAVAAAVEISACRDHWLGLRWVAALGANLSVLTLGLLAARGAGVSGVLAPMRPGVVLAAHIALLTVYLASTVDRTILRGLNITPFEIGQAAVAFLISIGGVLRVAGATPAGTVSAGLFCLLSGVACYVVSFAFLDRRHARDRNFYTYSTFGLLLVAVGTSLLLGPVALPAVWVVLAACLTAAGLLRERDTLRLHGAAYLLMAVLHSRMPQLAAERVMRARPESAPVPAPAYWLAWLGAAACYALVLRLGARGKSHRADAWEALLTAAVVCWGAAGAAAGWISGSLSGAAPLRTALVTALAIAAAWSGARWRRPELKNLAYPLLAVAGIKLLAEDFRQEHSLPLFASLILFGGGLILLPRLMRRRAA